MNERDNLLERRRLVSVTLLAVEQASKFLQVCATVSGDEVSAQRAVAEAFDVSELQARFMLDLQVRRFTPDAVERTRSELADIERQLDEYEGDSAD